MKGADPQVYNLEFFREKGFQRREGKRCKGEYFWTLNPEFEEPQDAPCVDYWFDKIPSRPPMDVGEARREFIRFFEERGHTPVKPRPVVARWREDLYLTIASIVVFQPHVTSGLVPPPANPLVISQPSIRLEDIDNVGITIGRHLTSFEMAAHHAFNYPDKQVYWKEETVRLAFDFFTERMGIPPEYIVFKESWWEGGGNAGPSFEVVVGGLELATLVFMMYKVEDGRYEEIPLKIVDTGYGVERLAWFTQKTPTAFHTIYGGLLPRYRRLLGLEEPPEKLLWAAFRAAGRLDPEDPASLEAYFGEVAERAGLPREEAKNILLREARVYSVLDHAKTLALMLGDGIVPSNTGEGYLARLVARRALRQLRLLGVEVDFVELVDMQIEYWSRDYPQLAENRDYILDATRWEVKRFEETLRKGESLVLKLLKKKRKLTLEDLITLYDSHGLPPEIVAEVAARRGVKVEVPHNFYSIVAARHKAPEKIRRVGEKAALPEEIVEWARGFPATRKLYYEDSYMRRFRSKVLGSKGKYVVLEATAFYPTGGGQLHDTGILRAGGEVYRVVRVEKAGDVVVHVLDSEKGPAEGSLVEGEIDWRRRYRLMRHHTGTHVILGAARRVLGNHVWQAGAEKTPEKARLDITHHKPLTREEVRRIEELANMVVDDRRRVRAFVLPRNEAEEKYGFQIYQGGVPMTPEIRLLEVEDWDVEACGGTHLSNTGEIGGLKIVRVEKIQDGVIRLEYVAGTRVVEEAQKMEDTIEQVARHVKADPSQVVDRVAGLVKRGEELEEALRRYRSLWMEKIIAEALERGFTAVEAIEPDRRTIQDILRKVTGQARRSVVAIYYPVDGQVQVEIAAGPEAGVDLGRLVRELAGRYGARGGGKGTYASVRVPRDRLEEFLAALEEAVQSGG